jgi:WD40 repeat protein
MQKNSAQRHDAFLSYNTSDQPAVEKLNMRLTAEAKLTTWLDRLNLIPGDLWQEGIEEALDESRACVVFLGPKGLGPWQNEEMRLALQSRVERLGFRVVPVLLPGAELPNRGELPRFLARQVWVDFRGPQGLDNDDEFGRLVAGILGVRRQPCEGPPLAAAPVQCPYRGLEVFNEADAKFFFGRAATTQHLVETLRPVRFLAVLGPSGSGKSSLVRAGLLPALKAGALPHSGDWAYISLTPGPHPLHELALKIAALAKSGDLVGSAREMLNSLESDERSLHLRVGLSLAGHPRESRYFFLIDQFEELFTLCRSQDERLKFIENIRYATTLAGGQTTVVLAMRADFLARAAESDGLAEMISGRDFVINSMDEVGLRQAIEEPARLVGFTFETGLVERIIKDIGREPGALPLLEHALLQLFERADDNRMMTQGSYDKIGGVQGAIAKRADEIFGALTSQQQEIARRVLLRLTQPGNGTEDTRRRSAMDELLTRGDDRPALEDVVEKLTDARLLTTSADVRGIQQVDVAHEALIRGWPLLRRWIDESRAALRVHRRVTEASAEWRERERDPSVLYRGARLAEVIDWRKDNDDALNDLEREFLDASLAQRIHEDEDGRNRQQRELEALRTTAAAEGKRAEAEAKRAETERKARRRERYFTVGLSILSLTALVISYLAVRQQRISKSRELAAKSSALLAIDPQLALNAAADAVNAASTEEAENALRQSLLRSHLRTVLQGHTLEVSTAQFSNDGKLVLTAGGDNVPRIWNPETGQRMTELRGHSDSISSAALSPDGRLAVTGSADRTARIWDTRTGECRFELSGNAAGVDTVAFSPSGKFVVTGSLTARVWSTESGRMLVEFKKHVGPVWSAAFSPAGDLVATASADNSAIVWSADTGQTKFELRAHTGPVFSVTFSRDGRLIATASYDGTARVWDAVTGRSLFEVSGHAGPVRSIAFSTDGKLIVTGSSDNTARVWDAETGGSLVELRGHTGAVLSAMFSPTGDCVMTASLDGTSRIWDVGTGREIAELRGHSGSVRFATFSPSGALALTASEDRTARIWSIHTCDQIADLSDHGGPIWTAAFSPNQKLVATGSSDNTAKLWDAEAGSTLFTLSGHKGAVRCAAFSPDNTSLVTGSDDHLARVWDAGTGQLMHELAGHSGSVRTTLFSPDGKFILTGSNDNTGRIWSAKTGQLIHVLDGHVGAIADAAFSTDAKRVATASWDTTARVWDADTGNCIAILRGHEAGIRCVVFSPDGSIVVTASNDQTARLWNPMDGHCLVELRMHSGKVLSSAFSPNGKLVATGSDDNTARVWETGGRCVTECRGHTGAVSRVAFSPNSKFLLTASDDHRARVWDVVTGEVLAEFRGHTDPLTAASFSSSGNAALTASEDGSARIYNSGVFASVKDLLTLVPRRAALQMREQ